MIFGRFLSNIGPKLVMTWNITLIVYLEGTNKYPNKPPSTGAKSERERQNKGNQVMEAMHVLKP